ncbi:cupin domain-containing protein [Roseicyclus sp. F158]|uniref:Cupin domain-containing protein n=1 Tax=Tropicimonas omnivorans TaxID=3075590 RepID=A0ABU3DEJ1_9RHOB|nr:cupin domain-containing protein [Roseicyclus sp. F158]MDT0681537.1 cupin domain-containing protein [Roseicyclus sp. F158]
MTDTGPGTADVTRQDETTERMLAAIGRRIRYLRKSRDMTLQQLAASSGVSASMLSLVERGLTSPSIGSLIVVGEALGVSISELMATDDHSGDLVVRHRNVQPVVLPEQVMRRMMREDQATGISLSVDEYAPGTSTGPVPITQRGVGHGFVIEGSLTVDIEGTSHVLEEGDLISFASDRPHRIRNHGDTPARTVWVNAERR